MTDIVHVPSRVRFADLIPYQTPTSLDELRGPTAGKVTVGGHIDTSLSPVYDVADLAERRLLYMAVVRSGTPADQRAVLNRDALVELWESLTLPTRCRALWESKFPLLAQRR